MAQTPTNPETLYKLGDLLGRLRKPPVPESFGTLEHLGDPTKFTPRTFPHAATVRVGWYDEPTSFGSYFPDTHEISIQHLPEMIERYKANLAREKADPTAKHIYLRDPTVVASRAYTPSILPHEVGHAIWMELAGRVDKEVHSSMFVVGPVGEATSQLKNWVTLHQKNLANNKALGDYEYQDDPSHSFADAFSAWVTNPAMLKNLFPDIYEYFGALATPKPPAAAKGGKK